MDPELTSIATWLQATGPYGLYVIWNQARKSSAAWFQEFHDRQYRRDPMGAVSRGEVPR